VQWLARIEEAQSRSHENFVVHFENKYTGVLPVWVVTELLDFGGLSTLFQGLKGVDRNAIAEELGVLDTKGGNGRAVTNWMHAMTYLRNICAHHSRLWNANMAVQLAPRHLRTVPALAHLAALDSGDLARSYPAICLVGYLLHRIEPETSWVHRALDLVQTLAATGRRPSEMGMPADWQSRLTAL
jgi:abortive infection bacteriophage resistance protein